MNSYSKLNFFSIELHSMILVHPMNHYLQRSDLGTQSYHRLTIRMLIGNENTNGINGASISFL